MVVLDITKYSPLAGLNRRPQDLQSYALPTELSEDGITKCMICTGAESLQPKNSVGRRPYEFVLYGIYSWFIGTKERRVLDQVMEDPYTWRKIRRRVEYSNSIQFHHR